MIHKLQDGGFVVSDGGTWLPGVYQTRELAQAALEIDCDELNARWEAVLANGRDTMTENDLLERK